LTDAALIQSLIATGAISGDKAANVQERNALYQQLAGLQKNADSNAPFGTSGGIPTGGVGVSQSEVVQLLKLLREDPKGGLNFGALGGKDLEKVATIILKLKGVFPELQKAGDDAIKQGIVQFLLSAGVSSDELAAKLSYARKALQDLGDTAEEADAAQQRLDAARTDALNKYAQRNAALQAGSNSGQYDKNAAGLATLKQQSKEAYDAEIKLINTITGLSTPAYQELQNQVSQLTGLENASTISKEQLSAAFIDNAIAMGLNAEQIKKIQKELDKLIQYSAVLNNLKTRFRIIATMDARQALATLKALRAAIAASAKAGQGAPGAYHPTAGQLSTGLGPLDAAISQLQDVVNGIDTSVDTINNALGKGKGSNLGSAGGGASAAKAAAKAGYDVSTIDLPEEIANAMNRAALIQEAIRRAKELQKSIPGAGKEAKNDIVELLKGTQNILEVRGVKDDLLRKSLEELAAIEKKRLDFETKADTIRRIRIGSASFAAIANVPVNSTSGVSLGGPQGPINVTLNLNGTVLTPAQLAQFADLVASALKRQIANG